MARTSVLIGSTYVLSFLIVWSSREFRRFSKITTGNGVLEMKNATAIKVIHDQAHNTTTMTTGALGTNSIGTTTATKYNSNGDTMIVPRKSNVEDTNFPSNWLVNRLHGEPARIILVHVGKTGGVTLYNSVPLNLQPKRKSLPCLIERITKTNIEQQEENNTKKKQGELSPNSFEQVWAECYEPPTPEPALGRHIVSHKHIYSSMFTKDQLEWILFKANTFLVTIRNPVARIVSAFNYHRQKSIKDNDLSSSSPSSSKSNGHNHMRTNERFFLQCFTNIDAVARKLILDRNKTEPGSCVTLAKTILQGNGPIAQNLQHFYHNYQYYANATWDRRPQVPVVVIRTEHLWDDARRLDLALGGNGTFEKLGHASHGSEMFHVKSGISTSEGMIAICCEIVQDIEVYQTIVLKALNLKHNEKIETLKNAFEECGIQYEKDAVKHPFSWSQWYQETCRT